MKLFGECMSCMIQQLYRAIKLLDPEISEEIIVKGQQKLMKVFSELDILKTTNVTAGIEVYRILGEILNTEDPYLELKEKYNKIAMDYYPKVKKMIEDSEDPLTLAIQTSIMGNAIDFGAPNEINIDEELDNIKNNDLGGPSNVSRFEESLKNAKNILVLGDNCGEIVFDKIFIETLLNLFPEKKITYSVRNGPIINDSTIKDANFVGMDKICPVVESSASAGIILERSSPEFIEVFNSADLILSKGQGNFETMVDIGTENTEVYFMLKAKCNLMEKIFNCPLGTLLLVKKEKEIIDKVA